MIKTLNKPIKQSNKTASYQRRTVWCNRWIPAKPKIRGPPPHSTPNTLTKSGYFVWFDFLCPINNLSVIKGRVFLGWTSTKLGLMFLLKDTTQWRRWGSNPRPFSLESSTLPLSHCAPYKIWRYFPSFTMKAQNKDPLPRLHSTTNTLTKAGNTFFLSPWKLVMVLIESVNPSL